MSLRPTGLSPDHILGVFGVTFKLFTPLLTSCEVGLKRALGMVVTGAFPTLFTTKDSGVLNDVALTVSMPWPPSPSLRRSLWLVPWVSPSLSGIPVSDLP